MRPWTKGLLSLFGPLLLALVPPGGAVAQQECYDRLPTERISMELRGADVQTTLRLLAQQYRINLVVTDEVTGSITLSFSQVPVRDFFRVVIDSAGLQCLEREGVLRISSAERLRKEEEERFKAEESRRKAEAETRKKVLEARREEIEFAQAQARGPLKEDTIRLTYADAEDVAKTLQGILGIPPEGLIPPPTPVPGLYAPPPPTVIGAPAPPPPPAPAPGVAPPPEALGKGLTIKAHKATNSIFIRYYEADLERIKKLVKEKLDIPLPQVQISAQMVIATKNALEQIGVQWGGAFATQRGDRTNTLVGSGFAGPVNPLTGLPALPASGTGVTFTPANPNFTKSSILPVDPATGLPTGGSIVNLPTAFLPTGAAPPALGLLFGIISSQFNINLAIQALETQGKARSLAEPKIVTVENVKALITRGFEVPFVSQTGFGGTQVQFKEALLKLEVTPTVIREGAVTRIKMKIVVENNEPDFSRAVQGNPPIFKRRGETEVVVREGERLVIGGVLVETESSTVRQVPLLGSIPILGWLFKSRETSSDGQELIVIITPTVLPVSAAGR